MKKLGFVALLLCFSFAFAGSIMTVNAAEESTGDVLEDAPPEVFGLKEVESADTGLQTSSIPTYVATIVQWVLGIIGVLLVALLVYGGFQYMTSAGDEKKIDSGKKIITYAIIGIVIVFAAFIISNYVISALTDQDGGTSSSYQGGSVEYDPQTGEYDCPGGGTPSYDPRTGEYDYI